MVDLLPDDLVHGCDRLSMLHPPEVVVYGSLEGTSDLGDMP
jgi:hypothetical protein